MWNNQLGGQIIYLQINDKDKQNLSKRKKKNLPKTFAMATLAKTDTIGTIKYPDPSSETISKKP